MSATRSENRLRGRYDPVSFIVVELSGCPSGMARRVRAAAEWTLRTQRITHGELAIAFVTLPEMKRMHAKWLGDASPTDVITFDLLEPIPRGRPASGRKRPRPAGRRPLIDGQIVICPAVARRQAKAHGVPHAEELLRYVVHGCLHLCGYDDRRVADARAMHIEQERVLKQILAGRRA